MENIYEHFYSCILLEHENSVKCGRVPFFANCVRSLLHPRPLKSDCMYDPRSDWSYSGGYARFSMEFGTVPLYGNVAQSLPGLSAGAMAGLWRELRAVPKFVLPGSSPFFPLGVVCIRKLKIKLDEIT